MLTLTFELVKVTDLAAGQLFDKVKDTLVSCHGGA